MDYALKTFSENNIDVESLTQDTALDFSHTDNFEEELLSITSVHPMSKDAVAKLLKKEGDTTPNYDYIIEGSDVYDPDLVKKVVDKIDEVYDVDSEWVKSVVYCYCG